MNLKHLCSDYRQARELRQQLEKKAEEIRKEIEEPLRESILALMVAEGTKSANIEGVGRVVRKNTTRFEITDIDAVIATMIERATEAQRNGEPLLDAMMFQQRLHQSNLKVFVDGVLDNCDERHREMALATMGLREVEIQDITFTPSKGATNE